MRFFRIRPNHFLTLTHTCVVLVGSKGGPGLHRARSNALPCDDFTRRWESPDVEKKSLENKKVLPPTWQNRILRSGVAF